VLLTMVVNADGSVRDVEVLESAPPGAFDRAAMDCLAQWVFEPAIYDGAPVATRAHQRIRFELQ